MKCCISSFILSQKTIFELQKWTKRSIIFTFMYYLSFIETNINIIIKYRENLIIPIFTHCSSFRFYTSKYFICNPIFSYCMVNSLWIYYILRDVTFNYTPNFIFLYIFSQSPFGIDRFLKFEKTSFMSQNILNCYIILPVLPKLGPIVRHFLLIF